MKYSYLYVLLSLMIIMVGCKKEEELSEYQRTEQRFIEELGCEVGLQQMWRTSVKIQVNVDADTLVKLWLLSSQQNAILYDYKELHRSGSVILNAPQGLGNTVYLSYFYKNRVDSKVITLTGKPLEVVNLSTKQGGNLRSKEPFPLSGRQNAVMALLDAKRNRGAKSRPYSLCGSSKLGNAQYYQLTNNELYSFFSMMSITTHQHVDTSTLGINHNYELSSNGPFWLTWTSGYKDLQTAHILGYYYHSAGTYDDIQYVDLSETHKWDYIDGLCKVQYQLDIEDEVNDIQYYPNQWYDANFDATDFYYSTRATNPDRLNDSAYCIVSVFSRYGEHISAVRGISFLIDVPEGMHIGFYLRSDEEPYPSQWYRINSRGVHPYTTSAAFFRGTCYSAADLNVDGIRRSSIWADDSVIWMGMEDFVVGGDNDCNDVIFCVAADVKIHNPDIIIPDLIVTDSYNSTLPWTLAFEDVYRDADFDFNDVVVKLTPNYEEEKCCVTLEAAGSTEQMYLCYNGPEGVINFGEVHDLFNLSNTRSLVNTTQSQISVPFVELDCVPWPKDYTMERDASRFYILVKRGTCADCTDTLVLNSDPGLLPKAMLVADEWKWPMEGVSVISAYPSFRNWAGDQTRTSFWNWHKNATPERYVSY